jgi:hypothetical protein
MYSTCIYIYIYIYNYYFGGTGVWTQSLLPAMLLLYYLSHFSSRFWVGYLRERVSLCAWVSLDHDPLICPSPCSGDGWQKWTAAPTHWLRLGLKNFAWASPKPRFSHYQPPKVARIIGVSHFALLPLNIVCTPWKWWDWVECIFRSVQL